MEPTSIEVDGELDDESRRAMARLTTRRKAAIVAFLAALVAVVAAPLLYLDPELRRDVSSALSGTGVWSAWFPDSRGGAETSRASLVGSDSTDGEAPGSERDLLRAGSRVPRFGNIVSASPPEEVSLTTEPRQVRGGGGFAARPLAERDIDASGGRSPLTVRTRIQGLSPSIQQCYERRMRTNGPLRGVVHVQFTVTPSGTVSGVGLRSGALRDRGLLLCLRSRLSSVRLGRGQAQRYVVPIRFVPSEGGD